MLTCYQQLTDILPTHHRLSVVCRPFVGRQLPCTSTKICWPTDNQQLADRTGTVLRFYQSFFPQKDRLNRSRLSKVIYKAGCWDCNEFYIGKTKQRLHDRKTEHFKALTESDHSSGIADHVKTTGHNIEWDHLDIIASGTIDLHCKIKETMFIQEL